VDRKLSRSTWLVRLSSLRPCRRRTSVVELLDAAAGTFALLDEHGEAL
jgi:hypothetical protein